VTNMPQAAENADVVEMAKKNPAQFIPAKVG
jgi:hypothetical protein